MALAILTDDVLDWYAKALNRLMLAHPLQPFVKRWALGDPGQFLLEIVRQGQGFLAGAPLELAMQIVRHVADLNHFAHSGMVTCAAHVIWEANK
jgi:hypothetical protein